MRNALLFLIVLIASPAARLTAGDWLTLPSTYTHDPMTGLRVNQFAAPQPALAPSTPSFTRSGYTHLRSTLQVGQSQDNYHRVDQWGAAVRPYGEWRYPYRPYSVPYPGWGAPLAGLGGIWGGYPYASHPGGYGIPGGGGGYGGHHGHDHHDGDDGHGGHDGHDGHDGHGGYGPPAGYGMPGGYGVPGGYGPALPPGQPNTPYPTDPNGPYPVAPWYDGYYPSYPYRPRRSDREFFQPPIDPPRHHHHDQP